MKTKWMWILGGLVGVLAGFSTTRMTGCSEPKIAFHGQMVGISDIDSVVASERTAAQNEAQDKLSYLLAEQKHKDIEFKNQIAKLGNNHATEVADLSAKYELDGSTAIASMEKVGRETNAKIDSLSGEGDRAKNNLLAQYQQRQAALGGITTAVGMLPGAAPFAGLISQALPFVLGLGGAGGAAALMKRGKQNEDDAWDEAHAKATQEAADKQRARDEAWTEAQQHMLLMMHTPTAAMAAIGQVGKAVPGLIAP